jgi:hypothetical protein
MEKQKHQTMVSCKLWFHANYEFSIFNTIIITLVTIIGFSTNIIISHINSQYLLIILDNNTSWIVREVYRVEHFNSVSPIFNFNASFYIVKTDGTASHSQDIYDLVLNDQPIFNNNSTILIETSTVTMKD